MIAWNPRNATAMNMGTAVCSKHGLCVTPFHFVLNLSLLHVSWIATTLLAADLGAHHLLRVSNRFELGVDGVQVCRLVFPEVQLSRRLWVLTLPEQHLWILLQDIVDHLGPGK